MTEAEQAALRRDGYLGGRLRLWQPARGYRAGTDAVLLAAACPACPGETVLELGCGVGTASLCLAARVPDLALTGIERQPGIAALARRNAAECAAPLAVLEADLARLPADIRQLRFDHVIANPPYFIGGTTAPDPGRGRARHEDTPLPLWIDAALRRLHPGGTLTLIQRADRLAVILLALEGRAGSITILPLVARAGREAGRVIVLARKGGRGPLRLLSPFIIHAKSSHSADAEDLTPAAQAVLREAAALWPAGPDFR